MTAESATIESPVSVAHHPRRAGTFLGFGTVFRKEIAEWLRGRRALVVGLVSVAVALLTTAISGLVGEAPAGTPPLPTDPTTNVLLGWVGLTFQIFALLATIALLTGERDRGTLAWNLSNPVSPTSVIAAKWTSALLVYAVVGVVIPLALSSALATIVYGSVPELATIGSFAGLYLTVPAFYIGLTVFLGTFVKSTAGIAGIGFAVMFLPSVIGSLLPIVKQVSPTEIGTWAMAVATGEGASALTLAGWAVSMAVLAIAAKIIFDRQEL
jgi:ABC-type transport system involved in multi-copper enzyme maturation permease subunit